MSKYSTCDNDWDKDRDRDKDNGDGSGDGSCNNNGNSGNSNSNSNSGSGIYNSSGLTIWTSNIIAKLNTILYSYEHLDDRLKYVSINKSFVGPKLLKTVNEHHYIINLIDDLRQCIVNYNTDNDDDIVEEDAPMYSCIKNSTFESIYGRISHQINKYIVN